MFPDHFFNRTIYDRARFWILQEAPHQDRLSSEMGPRVIRETDSA